MAKRRITDVEGIGKKWAQALSTASITNTDQLLESGATRAGRGKLAKETGLSEAQILKWVNMCDLFRIKGIAGQYAELLEAAGVDTVKELRTRNAENLAAKMKAVNDDKNLTRQVPGVNAVANWIDQAQDLPPKVTY
ncbi:MAG TPA: DUF4332 domain-containing protein [Gammaproteobacteria bacterium]|jgi:predicted flap endonuclease-1-like 5' DNA nuclease|nr:DUF4332 domain-containing protein [Gammaproteobacteria bacterium]